MRAPHAHAALTHAGDSSAGYLLEICLLFLNPQLKTTPLGYVYMWLLRRDGPRAMNTLQQTTST
jgi:hypothetical protein